MKKGILQGPFLYRYGFMTLPSSLDLTKLRFWIASQLVENATGPIKELHMQFTKAMQKIQENTGVHWTSNIQNRVWQHIQLNQSAILERALTEAVVENVLDEFEDEKIIYLYKAIQDKKQTEIERHKADFARVCQKNLEPIASQVHQKIRSITRKWLPELMQTLQQEGVCFPKIE